MGKPDNWQSLIRNHGWGTAPKRLKKRTQRNGACFEWIGPIHKGVPQIRISANGLCWTENAQRLAWMLKHGRFVPEELNVKRTCCNERCLSHLGLGKGEPISVCVYKKILAAAQKNAKLSRKLSPSTVKALRRALAEGRSLAPFVKRYKDRVTPAAIYFAASGRTHGPPGNCTRSMIESRKTGRSFTTIDDRDEIRQLIADGCSRKDIADEWGLSPSTIGAIVRYRGHYAADRP